MRLIDADALDWWYKGRNIRRVIDDAPTVDAVVVTRCKDCKNAYINSFSVASGEALCTLSGQPMQQDDFCSYGERRAKP
nr:MAG TPA: adenylate kinase [Caudoviricetes sp.]